MKLLLTLLVAAAINVIPKPASTVPGDGCLDLSKGKVEFVLDSSSGIPAEGYTLSVTPKGVRATASGEAGLFYARQTLLQLSGAAEPELSPLARAAVPSISAIARTRRRESAFFMGFTSFLLQSAAAVLLLG